LAFLSRFPPHGNDAAGEISRGDDRGDTDYPPVVLLHFNGDSMEDYVHSADILNAARFRSRSLQRCATAHPS
jgi:hypothetical protein